MKEEFPEHVDRIVVHSGTFHGDDAMCVALIKMLNPDVEIIRSNHPEKYRGEENTVIADTGYGKYDHHQADAKRRADGHLHAACGLLYEDIGRMIMPDEKAYEEFLHEFIEPIEDADNFNGTCQLYSMVQNCRPAWNSEESMDEGFERAVNLVHGTVSDFVRQAESRVQAEEIGAEAVENSANSKVVSMSKYGPWKSALADTTAEFAVYPYPRGGYSLHAVQKTSDSTEFKRLFPEEWELNPPEGCLSVHSTRAVASFDTPEHAVKAGKEAVSMQNKVREGGKAAEEHNSKIGHESVSLKNSNIDI